MTNSILFFPDQPTHFWEKRCHGVYVSLRRQPHKLSWISGARQSK